MSTKGYVRPRKIFVTCAEVADEDSTAESRNQTMGCAAVTNNVRPGAVAEG